MDENSFSDLDRRLMARAVELAALGRGYVEPNPMVGAVVARGEEIIGEGYHQNYGGPHAEVFALDKAVARARGATLFVTLEPCSHFGKTPPCADAVILAGISRVVCAVADPFPKVAGQGLAKLRGAGVEVIVGLGGSAARMLNAPYLLRLRERRPYIHVKWAMSADGKIATAGGQSQWITSPEARSYTTSLRGFMDAVAVGRGTVVADDPLLTARPPGPRVPTRVVFCRSGDLPARCQLLDTIGEAPVLVATTPGGATRLDSWREAGAEVLAVADDGGWLRAVLGVLAGWGMTNVWVEGGAGLMGGFHEARLIDEVHVVMAPKLIGGVGALGPLGGAGVGRLADAAAFDRSEVRALGPDVYVRLFREPKT